MVQPLSKSLVAQKVNTKLPYDQAILLLGLHPKELKVGTQTETYICIFIVSLFTSLVAQRVKSLPAMQETWVQSLGQEDPLEKEMATHSSILAWRIPWTEEPGRLQSTGSQRIGHD